jgi:signal transduction histidine kinase
LNKEPKHIDFDALKKELDEVRHQLQEANETIEAIRTGQIDALVVNGDTGPQLYTLKSADQTYRVFIEKMTEGAVTISREGLILYSNSQFAFMVQLPLSSVIGQPFEQFVVAESKKHYYDLFRNSWQADRKEEVCLISGDKEMPVQLSLTSLELEEGVSLSVIVTDLSVQKDIELQLRKKNEQLLETNRALEASNHDLQQFASVASHDLQEPLRKVQMFAHVLTENEELSVDSRKYLDKIIASSKRMKTLIMDILNYSRLSANDYSWEYVNLNDLVSELADDFELIIGEKGAVITFGDLPRIAVNKGQIRQVFQNIISNALKFAKSDEPPVINISSRRLREKSFDSAEDKDGAYTQISIRDNGIGFNQHYVQNIFYLFERLNSKDAYEGTGIGLAIAKKIIDKHHGLITAESAIGEGSVFHIILPVDPPVV